MLRVACLTGAAFVAVAAVLGLMWREVTIRAAVSEADAELHERLDEFTALHDGEGLAVLKDEMEMAGVGLWDEGHALFMLMEEGFSLLISDAAGRPVFGDALLAQAPTGWSRLALEDGEESVEVYVVAAELSDGVTLRMARPRADAVIDAVETFRRGAVWVALTALCLSALTGAVVQRYVRRRLDALASAVGGIGRGTMSVRAPLGGRGDEFDTVSEQVNNMLDRLEALTRNLETASVGMAHDLKTPVSRIANRLQLIRQDLGDAAALEQHLDKVDAQLKTVMQTFQGLLRLGDIESGKRRERFSRVDLSALCRDVAESFEPVFADAGRRLEVAVVPGLQLSGDPDLLVHMLSNLLENSIEYGRAGGLTWLRVQAHPEGHLVQVGDDGPGIADADGDRVFERFYRGDASRSTPGNGLGLSIVRAVCELHGGRALRIARQPGAVFDCYLPSAADAA